MVNHEGSASFIQNHAPNTPISCRSTRSATSLSVHNIGFDKVFEDLEFDNAETQVPQEVRESSETKGHHVAFQNQQYENAATQVTQKIRISSVIKKLKAKERIPSDIEALPDSRFAEEPFMQEEYRPGTATTVLQYADEPIHTTEEHPLGRPTRATVLRNLRRVQSAPSTCSQFSWIKENRRLCNIRDYYRLCKEPRYVQGESVHAYLTGGRFTSARWLDSVCLGNKGLYVNKENLTNVFYVPNPPDTSHRKHKKVSGSKNKSLASGPKDSNLLEIKGKGIYKDAGVITEPHYLSVTKWHGAEWQVNLPECYKPLEERYNSYSSINLRAKRVRSEYRDPLKMAFLREKQNKNSLSVNNLRN